MTVMSDSKGTEKDGGLGTDGTIPAHLRATVADEGSNFEHEEDPESAADDGGAADAKS